MELQFAVVAASASFVPKGVSALCALFAGMLSLGTEEFEVYARVGHRRYFTEYAF